MDAAAEIGRNPVSKHQIQPTYGDEQADWRRDCRNILARPNSQARTGTGKYSFFPDQLTTIRVDNLSLLILTLAICDDHINIHTHIISDPVLYCSYFGLGLKAFLWSIPVFYLPHSFKETGKNCYNDGLVGGNPTMNTPRLRRGGGDSFLFIFFYLYWYSYIVYFVNDSASEFGAMGSTSFLGFSYTNLFLVFSEPVISRNLYHIFLARVGTFSGSFYFYFCFSVPCFGLACDHGYSFLCLEE